MMQLKKNNELHLRFHMIKMKRSHVDGAVAWTLAFVPNFCVWWNHKMWGDALDICSQVRLAVRNGGPPGCYKCKSQDSWEGSLWFQRHALTARSRCFGFFFLDINSTNETQPPMSLRMTEVSTEFPASKGFLLFKEINLNSSTGGQKSWQPHRFGYAQVSNSMCNRLVHDLERTGFRMITGAKVRRLDVTLRDMTERSPVECVCQRWWHQYKVNRPAWSDMPSAENNFIDLVQYMWTIDKFEIQEVQTLPFKESVPTITVSGRDDTKANIKISDRTSCVTFARAWECLHECV